MVATVKNLQFIPSQHLNISFFLAFFLEREGREGGRGLFEGRTNIYQSISLRLQKFQERILKISKYVNTL